MIKPTGFHVLVEMGTIEEVSAGGIVMPKEYVDKEQGGNDCGTVIAIGPTAHPGYAGCDADTPEGRAAQWGYKIGDQVQFDRYQGKKLELEGFEDHRIITDSNIIAVIGE